jgi:uncharacterized membrane protein
VFGVMVAVDVLFSYMWMAVLLWMAAKHQRIDRSLKADTTAIAALSDRMEACVSSMSASRRSPIS